MIYFTFEMVDSVYQILNFSVILYKALYVGIDELLGVCTLVNYLATTFLRL